MIAWIRTARTNMRPILLTPNPDPTVDLGQELAEYVSMLLPHAPDIETSPPTITGPNPRLASIGLKRSSRPADRPVHYSGWAGT